MAQSTAVFRDKCNIRHWLEMKPKKHEINNVSWKKDGLNQVNGDISILVSVIDREQAKYQINENTFVLLLEEFIHPNKKVICQPQLKPGWYLFFIQVKNTDCIGYVYCFLSYLFN